MKDLQLTISLIAIGLIVSMAFISIQQLPNGSQEVLGPVNAPVSLWNSNSQKVADYLMKIAWQPQLGLLVGSEPSVIDYVDSLPESHNAWTTSNNVPTCWTLGDFGYANQMLSCESSAVSLGAFSYNNGMRYEVYTGNPIAIGNPGDQHTILQPVNGTNKIVCTNPPCPGHYYGLLGDGTKYGIECDCWNGGGIGTPNPNAGVDIAAPQAIDAWLFGDLNTFTTIENNLIARYTSSNYVGTGSVWQLGQVMFVMRIGGQDNTTAFTNMANMLWSLQNSQGYLPNTYTGLHQPGAGKDPENQDAGLLPYSTSLVNQVKSSFGAFATTGNTVTTTKTVFRTVTHTIALSTTTKTAITTTIKKLTTSTTTQTQCCVTRTTTVPIFQTNQITQTSTVCCAISTFTLSTTATSTVPVTRTTTQTLLTTQTGSTTLSYSTTYTFQTTQTAYSILLTTISYSTTITLSATTTLTQSTTQTQTTTTATYSLVTFTTITQTNSVNACTSTYTYGNGSVIFYGC